MSGCCRLSTPHKGTIKPPSVHVAILAIKKKTARKPSNYYVLTQLENVSPESDFHAHGPFSRSGSEEGRENSQSRERTGRSRKSLGTISDSSDTFQNGAIIISRSHNTAYTNSIRTARELGAPIFARAQSLFNSPHSLSRRRPSALVPSPENRCAHNLLHDTPREPPDPCWDRRAGTQCARAMCGLSSARGLIMPPVGRRVGMVMRFSYRAHRESPTRSRASAPRVQARGVESPAQ